MHFHRLKYYLTFVLSAFVFIAPVTVEAAIKFSSFNARLPNPFVKDIKETKNHYWIATAAGLTRFSKSGGAVKNYTVRQGLPDNYVTSVDVRSDESEAWLGTPSGLARLNLGNDNITVFNKQRRELTSDQVSAVLIDGRQVFVGTSFGVDLYHIDQNFWKHYTAIEGLAGNNIQTLVPDGDIVWAGGADGISYYDKNDDFWISYGAENGLTAPLVTSLVIDADAIWVGTLGAGIARFDRTALRFEPFGVEYGLTDGSVQALMDDGLYLWIGTFDGLSRMEKSTFRFQNYHTKDGIAEPSVFAGLISGNYIFAGTDGRGIFRADKNLPQVSFSYEKTGYKKKGLISIAGTMAADAGIDKVSLKYKPAESLQGDWKTENITVTEDDAGQNIEIGELKASTLTDGKYTVSIEITDKKGQKNISSGTVVVDNIAPKIDVIFRPPREGEREATVSGRYFDLNLKVLRVEIGDRKVFPSIDRQQKRFRFPYPVNSGAEIKIIAEDVGLNRVTETKEFIIDNDPPEIKVNPVDGTKLSTNIVPVSGTVKEENLDQVIVNPGQIPAEVTPVGNGEYEFIARAPIKKEGLYTFQVTAFDKSGRTTTEPLEVKFYSDETIVEINEDKIPEFTLRDYVEISGNILGPLLKDFRVDPGNLSIPVDDDKSFEIKVPLKPGKNRIKITATHTTGEQAEREYEIDSNKKTVGAPLNSDSKSFSTENVVLRGTFEKGVSKVLVNAQPAQMNMANQTYEKQMQLKQGKNPVEITVVDELGRVKKQTQNVILDTEAPRLYLRPLPAQTGLQSLKFKGTLKDDSGYTVTTYPTSRLNFIQSDQGKFEGQLKLKKGINRIFFTVEDAAGNTTRQDFLVEYDEKYAKREVGEGATNQEELLALQDEIERLKKLLASRPAMRASLISRSRLPEKSGLFLVPMAGKIGSYDLASKLYLGTEALADVIASYNGTDPRRMSRVLVPSPQLFQMLNNSRYRDSFDRIIQQSGVHFISKRSSVEVEKGLLRYLIRSRQLRTVRQRNGYNLFVLKNGSGVAVIKNATAINSLKGEGLEEILVATINPGGMSFNKL